ncbi:MAG: nicotinamide riboside transporter PnuC [Eubacteriales bacterium]|nr:nicotinamide riboside transporter PnuC [Eubacteriales bacterium]
MQRWIFICAGLVALAAVSKAALKKKRVERGEEPKKAEEPALAQKPANRALRTLGILLAVLLFCSSLGLGGYALTRIWADAGEISGPISATFVRATTAEEEDYDEDNTVCRVEYKCGTSDAVLAIEYTYAEWEALPEGHTVEGYIYRSEKMDAAVAFREMTDAATVAGGLREVMTDREALHLNIALALMLVAIGSVIMTCGWHFYSAYEKTWFLAILVLAAIFGIIFPEEDCNGISGIVIMALYLADTLLNIWCELLISKQSKWNFIVSVFVELAEIGICILLRYRFATMATTLFFWLPIDIISFVNWHRHPDRREEELTVVRTLRGWQEVLVLIGIAVWTFGLGYLLTRINVGTDLFGGNETLATLVIYLDACASAVGVANGLFILFRFREQWVAWITCAILEAVINVLSGQYVLLVLKAGYLTNSVYGYIKWTKYIKTHRDAKPVPVNA